MMARRSSSRRWLERHFDDEYVKRAQQAGYRSRAAFKLLELNARDRIFRTGANVVDLGAAPGGWSQVARELVGSPGRVVAIDLLPIEPALAGVEAIIGDFSDETVCLALEQLVGMGKVDVVLSDMSPNLSGIREVDQPRGIYLAELAIDFASHVLVAGGNLVVKTFQGEGVDSVVKQLRNQFEQVAIRKPKASRSESREIYLVSKRFGV